MSFRSIPHKRDPRPRRTGDFFQVDAGQVKTRVYEVAGTRATIFLTGDSNITQVFVRLLGS